MSQDHPDKQLAAKGAATAAGLHLSSAAVSSCGKVVDDWIWQDNALVFFDFLSTFEVPAGDRFLLLWLPL